jgi:hypothetical protein
MTTATYESCRACGRVPAQVFPIRRHVGMILMQQFIKVKVPLCRDHALETTKQFTVKTLWQGWWGYISFFVNWFVLASNLIVLSKVKSMPAPQAPAVPALPEQPTEAATETVLD